MHFGNMKFKQKQREEQAEPDGTEGGSGAGGAAVGGGGRVGSQRAPSTPRRELTAWHLLGALQMPISQLT